MRHPDIMPKSARYNPYISYALLPPLTSYKKTLVLDLDETLIHTSLIPTGTPDLILNAVKNNESVSILNVYFRPYASELLKEAGKLFEVIIYTASMKRYADPIIDSLDVDNNVSHRLYRNNCVYTPNGYIKDLSLLGRNLKNVIIVDDLPISYQRNPDNAIPIDAWINGTIDNTLERILILLKELANVDDVRKYLKNAFRSEEYNYERIINRIKVEERKFIVFKPGNIPKIAKVNLHKYPLQNMNYKKIKDVFEHNKSVLEKEPLGPSRDRNKKKFVENSNCLTPSLNEFHTIQEMNLKKLIPKNFNTAQTNSINQPLTIKNNNTLNTLEKSSSSSKCFIKSNLLIRRGRLLINKENYIFEDLANPLINVKDDNRHSLPFILH